MTLMLETSRQTDRTMLSRSGSMLILEYAKHSVQRRIE
jgi:hypothetical protein